MLKKVNDENKQFALLFVTDTTGQQVSRSDDGAVVNNSDRDYFKDVVSKKKTVISDVLISKATNKPSVVIVVPIFTEQGEFKGVVGGTLDLSNMEEMRSKIKMGETGKAFVTDSKGQVLVHADEKMAKERTDITDISIVKKALSGESGAEVYEYNGEKIFASYTMVPKLGWAVVVEQVYNDAYSSVSRAK